MANYTLTTGHASGSASHRPIHTGCRVPRRRGASPTTPLRRSDATHGGLSMVGRVACSTTIRDIQLSILSRRPVGMTGCARVERVDS